MDGRPIVMLTMLRVHEHRTSEWEELINILTCPFARRRTKLASESLAPKGLSHRSFD